LAEGQRFWICLDLDSNIIARPPDLPKLLAFLIVSQPNPRSIDLDLPPVELHPVKFYIGVYRPRAWASALQEPAVRIVPQEVTPIKVAQDKHLVLVNAIQFRLHRLGIGGAACRRCQGAGQHERWRSNEADLEPAQCQAAHSVLLPPQ